MHFGTTYILTIVISWKSRCSHVWVLLRRAMRWPKILHSTYLELLILCSRPSPPEKFAILPVKLCEVITALYQSRIAVRLIWQWVDYLVVIIIHLRTYGQLAYWDRGRILIQLGGCYYNCVDVIRYPNITYSSSKLGRIHGKACSCLFGASDLQW